MAVAVHHVVSGAAVYERHGILGPERLQRRPRNHHPDDAADRSPGAGAPYPGPARDPTVGAHSPPGLARLLRAKTNDAVAETHPPWGATNMLPSWARRSAWAA